MNPRPLLAAALFVHSAVLCAQPPIDIGSRLELFVDRFLIERLGGGADLRLHQPVPRELAFRFDRPWEGNSCGYSTVFRDGDIFRMYYRGGSQILKGEPPTHKPVICYAESKDGIHWTRPHLGLVDFQGSKNNNIVLDADEIEGFSPFKDENPKATPDARYKAVGAGKALYAYKSPDGIHWTRMSAAPIITKGAFDSQNLAFWDPVRSQYRAYVRDFREAPGSKGGSGKKGDRFRDIRTAVSDDFLHWSDPVYLEYPGAPNEELYTNQVIPYYRAPHLLLAFPTRYSHRGWSESLEALPGLDHRKLRSATSEREGSAVTDGLFMSSRDGRVFHRWDSAFLRPGLRLANNWVYGDNYQNWGLIETRSPIEESPNEISIYANEAYWMPGGSRLRRFSLRIDGFVSVSAPGRGGEMVTKPVKFTGKDLRLNFSTSAAGSIRVEVQEPSGTPIAGYSLGECPDIFGDDLDRVFHWSGRRDLAALAGKAVRFRFVLKDADLYSIHVK